MTAKRTAGGRFAKGATGNAGSRPAVVKPLQELARTHTAMAIRTLAHVAKKGKNESARITAASMLLDRGYGRPPQSIDIRALFEQKLTELTMDELAALEQHLEAIGGDPDESEQATQH
jgi:hypothetical protein